MDQRTQFIADYLHRELSITELCERYEISRKTGYKWIDRYRTDGAAGLLERSCRPHRSPSSTPTPVVEAIVQLRERHPTWDAKKLLKVLSHRDPSIAWPARSTVCDILDREGWVPRKPRRRPIGHPGKPSAEMSTPNQVWCADFKGQFKTLDGIYCYPLTVTDGCTRFLLECRGLDSVRCGGVMPIFTRLFREYGMPLRIRTDNGPPFASDTLARLSRLSAWWVRLGVLPDLIEPGKPQQNGRHERMHRTLKAETTRPPAANARGQQRKFNAFRQEFNFERPHEALQQQTPASLYCRSPRTLPDRIAPFEYPAHFHTRHVCTNGFIHWRNGHVRVSLVCAGDQVGLEEVGDGEWDVHFGVIKLGRLFEDDMTIEDANYTLKTAHPL